MYNYIFWVIYNRNINRSKSEWLSRNNASGVVFIALLVHLLLVVQIIKRLFSVSLRGKIELNKGILGIVFLLCILFVYLYYPKSKVAKLDEKYRANESVYVQNGGWIVAALVFIPLGLILILG
jgi:hypothetical protein